MKAPTGQFKEALEGCVSRGEAGNILTAVEALDIISELEAAEARAGKSVFVLTFRHASSQMDSAAETIGVYATEDLAKGEIDKRRQAHLARGGGFIVQEHNDGRGVTLHHEMGSMSFVPGVFSYKEHPVVSA